MLTARYLGTATAGCYSLADGNTPDFSALARPTYAAGVLIGWVSKKLGSGSARDNT